MAVALHSPPSSPSFCVLSDGVKQHKDEIRRTAGGSFLGKVRKPNEGKPQPSTSSSIPSKYQTFFTSTTENKGFHQQAPRFNHLNSNDNPGPGSYLYNQSSSVEQNSSSYSAHGTGGLASKTKRFLLLRKSDLGPGRYDPSVPPKQQTFNKSPVTSNFHQTSSLQGDVNRKSSRIPAPNSYDVNLTSTHKSGACAAFRSRYKRNEPFKLYTASNPAPGQYDVKDDATRPAPQSHVSCFKTVLRKQAMFNPREGPGPGAYNPSLSIGTLSRPDHIKSRHLLTFSAPAIPLPPDPPHPGPGHYEVVDYRGPAKHESSGAVFVSASSRWCHTGGSDDYHPGPGAYQPTSIGKQSFLYNLDAKWI